MCCGIWWCGLTNNELVNATPSKEGDEGDFLLHLYGGVGRGSTPPKMGGRPCSHRERCYGGELTIVTISPCLRECGMIHKKLNTFSKLRQMKKYDVHMQYMYAIYFWLKVV